MALRSRKIRHSGETGELRTLPRFKKKARSTCHSSDTRPTHLGRCDRSTFGLGEICFGPAHRSIWTPSKCHEPICLTTLPPLRVSPFTPLLHANQVRVHSDYPFHSRRDAGDDTWEMHARRLLEGRSPRTSPWGTGDTSDQ